MAEKKRSRLYDEWKIGTSAPFQLWENGVMYTENCRSILDVGDGYLRLKIGKEICTLYGTELEVLCYQGSSLLLRGRLKHIEFG
jgi:hypothetical protein